MKKKTFVTLLLILTILTPVFADFNFYFGTDFSISGTKAFKTKGITDLTEAQAYVEVTYAEKNFNADVKGRVSLSSNSSAEYDFERIFASYKMKSFDDNTLTIMAGKYPSTWGLGKIDGYLIGDIITPEDNEYSISASQEFDKGWSSELQAVMPLDNDKTFKIGAQGRKGFSSDVLNEARLSIVFNPTDKIIGISAATDLTYWAEISAGADFAYIYDKDASTKTELVFSASALKDFDVEINSRTRKLTEALSLNFIIEGGKYAQTLIVNHADLELTNKSSIYSKTTLGLGGGITEFIQILGATYTLERGLVANGYVTIDTDSITLTADLSYNY